MSHNELKNLKINIPSNGATKQLSMQSTSQGRKLIISSNWLRLFGFEKGVEVIEEVIGEGQGMVVRLATKDDQATKLVYERSYKSRKNNPLETQLDIRGQRKLNEAFPLDTKNVHVTFQKGKITIVSITERQAERIEIAKNANELMSAFVAMSGGVDAYALHKEGFKINTLLEWRPNEKRDKRDCTEVNSVNALGNVPVGTLINEDIGEINLARLAQMTEGSKSTLLHASLSCDDFSNAKGKSYKQLSMEDMSTSMDQVYDLMRIIETEKFPTILIENVGGFLTSDANSILESKLRKWNYTLHKTVAYAPEYGGKTGRKRYYMFATSFSSPFYWPQKQEISSIPIWDEMIKPYLSTLRDVTHSKSIQDGSKCGRLRVINKDSLFSPTLLKSQNRMAKDSVVIETEDGRYLFPDNAMLKRLMGIPTGFDSSCVGDTIENEIIGQSVDFTMHHKIIQEIKKHIALAANTIFGRRQLSFF